MDSQASLPIPAKLLLLASILSKQGEINQREKALLKEVILKNDTRSIELAQLFDSSETDDASFISSVHQLIDDEGFALYEDIFSECSIERAKALSKLEREEKNLTSVQSLIYGEVDFHSFTGILRSISLQPGAKFYDLGSGTGRAIIAACITQDFSACIGIEFLQNLHEAATGIIKKFNERMFILDPIQNIQVDVYNHDILQFDWSDGDVVFANSTCFDENLMEGLAKEAEKLKPGSIFITFTKDISSEKFEVISKRRYKMSWGPATVYIQKKKNDNESEANKLEVAALDSLGTKTINLTLNKEESKTIGNQVGVNSLQKNLSDNDEMKQNNIKKQINQEASSTSVTAQSKKENLKSSLSISTGNEESQKIDNNFRLVNLPHISTSFGISPRTAQQNNNLSSPQDSVLMKRKQKIATEQKKSFLSQPSLDSPSTPNGANAFFP